MKKLTLVIVLILFVLRGHAQVENYKDFAVVQSWSSYSLGKNYDIMNVYVNHSIVDVGEPSTTNGTNYIYMQSFIDSRGEVLYYHYPITEMYKGDYIYYFRMKENQIEAYFDENDDIIETYFYNIKWDNGLVIKNHDPIVYRPKTKETIEAEREEIRKLLQGSDNSNSKSPEQFILDELKRNEELIEKLSEE